LYCVGYDGVDEFFPSLLELIQCKVFSADVLDQTSSSAGQSDDDNSTETVCALQCSKQSLSSPISEADSITENRQQPPSATKWYYIASDFCKEYAKPPTSCSQTEHPLTDGKGTIEQHAFTFNGFTEH